MENSHKAGSAKKASLYLHMDPNSNERGNYRWFR